MLINNIIAIIFDNLRPSRWQLFDTTSVEDGFEGIGTSDNLMVQDLVSMVDAQELPIQTV